MLDPRPDKSRAKRFFESAWRRFRKLAETPGTTVVQQLKIAGRTVELQVSAGAMEQALLPAFAHLADPGTSEPDIVLCAWDSLSTDSPSLSPGWSTEDYRQEGYISGFNDSRFHTAAQFEPTIVRMLDMEQGRALYWTPSALELPLWERGAPLRPLLHEWLRRIGMVGVHGGAVGRADGGLFLAGAGGRGKSNVALSCLNSNLFYAADDFFFLSRSPHWTVHSLYCSGKLAPGDLVRHAYLRGAESNPNPGPDEKLLFFLRDKFSDRLIRDMPLRAIVLPRVIAHGPSRVIPIPSSATAQKVVALSTIEMSRWAGRDALKRVTEIVSDLPCFELQLGANIGEVPGLLDALLNDLSPNPAPRAQP